MNGRRLVLMAMAGLGFSVSAFAQVTQAKAAPLKAASAKAAPIRRLRPDQVDAMLAALAGAEAEGFKPGAFATTGLDAARTGDATAQAALMRRVAAYAAAQHGLSIPRDQFEKDWGLKPAPYDAAKDLRFALAQDRLQPWLDSLPPPFARYRQLRDGLAVYARLAAEKSWAPTPAGSDLRMGAAGSRVKALRARLIFEDGPLAATPLDAPFDAALEASVKRFQTRHGLNPTGVVSHATLAALNVPPGQRVRQLRANMERWRWVPRNLPATRIEENTPAGFVQVYEDGQPTLGMRAVAGRPDDRTPMLQAKISSIVLNPSWRVPASIAPEIYAKGRKNKAYFAQQGFSAQPGDKVAPLIQKPGPKNALGQIKFDFDNAYGVYLHDTPGQAAFSHASRAISHGCVRLEKPVELATLLLAANADWPRDRIEAAIREGRTQRVTLKRPAPLYMFYFTAYGEGAQISFKRDIYGWDAKLLRLLDAGPIGQG